MTTEQHEASVLNETPAQVVVRLLRQGGHALVVGGGVGELPDKYRNHPQILLWDDRQQGLNSREVPRNTKAILYNRFLSHKTAIKLRKAAEKLRIPVFAMLEPRKIRELLSEVMQEELTTTPVAESEEPEDNEVEIAARAEVTARAADVTIEGDEPREQSALLMKENVMHKPGRGEMGDILVRHLKDEETPSAGARRLVPLIRAEYNITIKEPALAQAIRNYRIKRGTHVPMAMAPRQQPAAAAVATNGAQAQAIRTQLALTTRGGDDFEEAERLLTDAAAAIALSLDFVQNLKKKHTAIADREKKLREFLLTE